MPSHLAIVFGTRPEAIKMMPVIARAQRCQKLRVTVVNSGQHREMVDDFLRLFSIVPDVDFAVMQPGQTLSGLTSRVLQAADGFFERERPDAVLVHGDTTTAFAVALAAFYRRVPVGHVEAGLRTFDLDQPFPEEMNRVFVDSVAKWHFAPTQTNVDNLAAAGIARESLILTGNTVIDAVQMVAEKLRSTGFAPAFLSRLSGRLHDLVARGSFILMTAHRRENHGAPLRDICEGVRRVARRFPELAIVYPVHPNPNVQAVVTEELGNEPNVALIEPQDYETFMWMMMSCRLALTDSGGIQEEAPALGRRVVVMRETTERPEVVASGWGVLAGTSPDRIENEVAHALLAPSPVAANPFGDGHASERIISTLVERL